MRARIGEEKVQQRGRSGRKHCDEQSAERRKRGAQCRWLAVVAWAGSTGDDGSRISPGLKPDGPFSAQLAALSLKFSNQSPTNPPAFLPNSQPTCPGSYSSASCCFLLLLAASCCFLLLSPLLAPLPSYTPRLHLLSPCRSCFLPQATPTTRKTCFITPQRIICCTAAIILQHDFSSARGSHLPQGLWHTGAPVIALITPGFKPLSCS
jgi:hypothetical protein